MPSTASTDPTCASPPGDVPDAKYLAPVPQRVGSAVHDTVSLTLGQILASDGGISMNERPLGLLRPGWHRVLCHLFLLGQNVWQPYGMHAWVNTSC